VNVSGILNYTNWTLLLRNGNYTWNCLATDASGNLNWSTNRSVVLNLTDTDEDGVPDVSDNLKGNETHINNSGFTDIGITINKSLTLTNFTGTPEVWVYDNNTVILNFTYNFSAGNLDLSKVTIVKATNSILVNMSGQMQSYYNKTISITDNNFASLCVKDAEISAISEVSSGCNGDNETDFTSCLGGSATINGVECVDSGSIIHISNLRNSAVKGTPASSSSSSGGGGGGGGGSLGFWSDTYNVNESEFKTGYTRTLQKKQRLKLSVSGEVHYVGIIDISSSSVTINVSSKTQQAIFGVNDLRKFDVTDDKVYDLSVKLNSISGSNASITVQKISEIVSDESESITGKAIGNESTYSEETKELNTKKGYLWLLIVVILIVVVGLIVYWFIKKKKQSL